MRTWITRSNRKPPPRSTKSHARKRKKDLKRGTSFKLGLDLREGSKNEPGIPGFVLSAPDGKSVRLWNLKDWQRERSEKS